MSESRRSVAAIADRLPPGRVSVAEADRLAVSTDLWPRHLIRLAHGEAVELPTAVVWPESVAELSALVAAAREHAVGLVPYGAGSSVVGGATPTAQQVVVDLKRMRRLLDVDARQGTATAEAGIIGELLERQLNRQGFTQGHFPSSIVCSTLGGWIAARSAGQMSSRYGKIEDQLVGGTLVLGDGRVMRQAPSVVRDAAFDSLVGAEGSLALWAEATVRIHRPPAERRWRGFIFPSLLDATLAVQAWLQLGISPAVVRIYDALDTWLHHQSHGAQQPRDRGPSRLAWLGANLPRLTSKVGDLLASGLLCIVGVQGEERQVEMEMGEVLRLAKDHRGRDLGPEPGQSWYERRYAVSFGQSRAFRGGAAVDTMEVACTWDRILPTYEAVRRAALASGAQVLAHFSHVYVDGGSIYFTYALPIAAGVDGYDRLWRACLTAASEAGANVSHHHGTGKLKAGALAAALGGARDSWLEMQRHLDPDRVLNPSLLADPPEPVGALAPVERSEVPEMVAAPVGESLASLEDRLLAEGVSLGPCAALFAQASVEDAARAGWLWRFNSQVRVVESLVAGLDAEINGSPHRFTPAPRAAMGPDLTSALLSGEVERIWLRATHRRARVVRAEGDSRQLLPRVARVAADEAAGAASMVVRLRGAAAAVDLWLPDGLRGNLVEEAAGDLLGRLTREAPAALEPVGQPLLVAGTWLVLRALAAELAEEEELTLFAVDPLGAVGCLSGGATPGAAAGALRQRAEAHGLVPAAEYQEVAAVAPGDGAIRVGVGEEPLQSNLDLRAGAGALDNCTYCPKLCRFACPVSLADGNEALLPRQLMLTTNLHRKGLRRLSGDVAARLWSCVDCRSCRSFCDHGNDVPSTLVTARSRLLANGEAPPQVRAYLSVLASSGRPPDRPHGDDPTCALEVDDPHASTWLFLGCQGSAADPGPARAALALAQRHFGRVNVLRGPLTCCGHPLWRWGAQEAFGRYARAFAAQLGMARRLVVDDGCCAHALGVLYPEVGLNMPEVVTTTALLREESWQPTKVERWAVHDNAFTTRWLGEPSIANLRGFTGLDLPEGSVLAGEGGSCGSMLLPIYDAELADKVAHACVADLLGGGARRVLTASPSCRRRLRSTGAEVDDLLEIWHAATS